MYPAPFEYHAPGSVDEAIQLLGQYEDEGKLLAGGHSLLPVMKLRFAQPKHLIDLRKIPGLAGVREEGNVVVIGAMTTHWQVLSNDIIRRRLPILAETASRVGDPLVRNMGTLGASLAHADPAADLPATILVLDAELRVVGPGGSRTIKADDFFVDLMTSALEPSEVLTEVRIPVPPAGTGGAYEKYPHPASGYALVGVAALVTLDGGRTIGSARVAITGLANKATRASGVEEALAGKAADASSLESAAERAAEGLEPRTDLQGSAEYKAHLARVYTKRALTRAVERARA